MPLPFAMRRDDSEVAGLFYNQVGSLRVVADMDNNMIKDIRYDPFGGIVEDTNPDLRLPLGFAGGLHDRDLGFVRFGWRDYDVRTGRWTAPDPIGDKGGDPDWYGYCLDDPVNKTDPLGLFVPLLIGLAGATGIAGIGTTLAGLAADGLGALAGKNKEDPLKATKGAARGFAGAAAINSAMAAGAAGAAEAVEAAPAVISAAPTLIRQGRDAAKAAVSKGGEIAKVGLDWARTNPDKIDKVARIGKDIVDPNLPPETPEGQLVTAGKFLAQEVNDRFEKGNDVANEQKKKSKHIPSGVWGR
ncbi:RHS repeat domain-containing protein [Pseudodesulfovibrio karagichevae]|uniref:RHS repeat domain-containing protein n=1 Tax=Pseudodesulfovibrio karagichevae TaxID=3239305 RepID=A0ABV4K698_9BACT